MSYYERNKQKWLKYNSDRRERLKRWYHSIKSKLKCLHCGSPNDLEFHHPDPSLKEYCVSTMVMRGYSKYRIQSEMDKCIPLCDYCHASFTYPTEEAIKRSG